jgi:hypothetical protein
MLAPPASLSGSFDREILSTLSCRVALRSTVYCKRSLHLTRRLRFASNPTNETYPEIARSKSGWLLMLFGLVIYLKETVDGSYSSAAIDEWLKLPV